MSDQIRNTGPMLASPRCGAKTRSGDACRSPAVNGRKRCPHARRCTGIRRAKGKPERAQARPVHQRCDRRAKGDSDLVGGSAEAAGGDEVISSRSLRGVTISCEVNGFAPLGMACGYSDWVLFRSGLNDAYAAWFAQAQSQKFDRPIRMVCCESSLAESRPPDRRTMISMI